MEIVNIWKRWQTNETELQKIKAWDKKAMLKFYTDNKNQIGRMAINYTFKKRYIYKDFRYEYYDVMQQIFIDLPLMDWKTPKDFVYALYRSMLLTPFGGLINKSQGNSFNYHIMRNIEIDSCIKDKDGETTKMQLLDSLVFIPSAENEYLSDTFEEREKKDEKLCVYLEQTMRNKKELNIMFCRLFTNLKNNEIRGMNMPYIKNLRAKLLKDSDRLLQLIKTCDIDTLKYENVLDDVIYESIEKPKEYQKKYRLANREKLIEWHKKHRLANYKKISEFDKHYRLPNPEKVRAWKRKYRLLYPEKVKESFKKCWEKNKEKYKEKYKEKSKKYNEKHRYEINIYAQKYREEHREEINKKALEYHHANSAKINERKRQYREEHKEEVKAKDKAYRLANAERISERRKQYRLNNLELFRAKERISGKIKREKRKKLKAEQLLMAQESKENGANVSAQRSKKF